MIAQVGGDERDAGPCREGGDERGYHPADDRSGENADAEAEGGPSGRPMPVTGKMLGCSRCTAPLAITGW